MMGGNRGFHNFALFLRSIVPRCELRFGLCRAGSLVPSQLLVHADLQDHLFQIGFGLVVLVLEFGGFLPLRGQPVFLRIQLPGIALDQVLLLGAALYLPGLFLSTVLRRVDCSIRKIPVCIVIPRSEARRNLLSPLCSLRSNS